MAKILHFMRRDGKLLPAEGAYAGEGDALTRFESFTLGAVRRPGGEGGGIGDAGGSRLLFRRLRSGPGGMRWLGPACDGVSDDEEVDSRLILKE